MSLSLMRAVNGVEQAWQVIDGAPSLVADHLLFGDEVRAVCSVRAKKVHFDSASWLFVEFTQTTKLVSVLIAHPFTTQHATLLWLDSQEGGLQHCLIGFVLPKTIYSAARYKLLLSGLAMIYQAKEPSTSTHAWRVPNSSATVLQGTLDEKTLENLAILGQETKVHRLGKGMIRSRVRLDRDANIQLRTGVKYSLASLEEGTAVFCPIHLDTIGVASVIGRGEVKAVQCPLCGRNYWNVANQTDVNFGRFRQVIDQYFAQQPGDDQQFTLLHEQYLPPLKLQMGTTLIRSPKGSGKTEALKALVEKCREEGMSVLLIGHRRALLRAQSERIDLDLYFEIVGDDGKGQFRAIQPSENYAICLDSVPNRLRPDIHKFDVVLIDESEQVIRHLAGDTLKEARRLAFGKLSHYLSVAKAVYFLDADLGILSFSLAEKTAPSNREVRFIINEPEVEIRQYELLDSKKALIGKLEAALDAGEKCYVATNSKNMAESLGLALSQRKKNMRIQVVTRDNSQDLNVQDLLCNVVEEFQTGRNGSPPLDVLIGTPSIGTGIDITFPDNAMVVDNVFGIFEGNVTTHFDIDQQLARVRHPGKVSVWISPDVMFYETSPNALLTELRNTVLRTDVQLGFTRDGLPIYSDADKSLVKLWSEIMSHERTSKNNLLRHWVELRDANGWAGVKTTACDDELLSGEVVLQDGKALRDERRVSQIMGAANIDSERAEELIEQAKLGTPMTIEDKASLEKYRLGEFYADQVDEKLVGFDDAGRMRRHVEMLEIMIGDDNLNRYIDLKETDRRDAPQVVVFDRQFRTVKAELLIKLLASAGLVNPDSGEFLISVQFSTDSLKPFVTSMRNDFKRIEAELGVVLRKDIERKPVQQLGDVLKLIGVNLLLISTTKEKGVKRRSYCVDVDGLTALIEVVVRRQEARQKRRENAQTAKANARDNDPPNVNSYLERQLSPMIQETGEVIPLCDTQVSPIEKLVAASRARKSQTKEV